MHRNKWMTGKEAWILANKLAQRYGNIENVANKLGIARSTIYKWGEEDIGIPDVRTTEALKTLAIREGLIKS